MVHTFDIDVAEKYGLHSAIIICNFQYWLYKNKANKVHFYDGHYWTYNSISALKEMFPYFSEKQIRTTLDKLVNDNVLIKGNFNKNKYDKTIWYAFKDEDKWLKNKKTQGQIDGNKRGASICPQGQMDVHQKCKPIPNINTNINTDKNTNIESGNKIAEKEQVFLKLGEFKNVSLTIEQIKKLIDIYDFAFDDAIETLSSYIATKGKQYKNHYAVLGQHNWVYSEVQKHPEYQNNHKVVHIPDPTTQGGLRKQTAWEYYNQKYGWEK